MANARYLVEQFELANPLYINATVYAYTVLNGVKTTTLATLYADPTSANLLQNPVVLDSTGKFPAHVYIDVPVILSVAGFGNVPEHDTGIIAGNILLAQNYATAAAASAADALASETVCTTQAGIATTQAGNAAASAVTAASAAAALMSTSTTSLAIGTGAVTFATQSGKQFAAGQFILAVSAADPTNFMHGQVTSYAGTALVIDSQDVGGSGTHADWAISISGTRGQGGSALAGGTNGQIQYNNGGNLGGITSTGTGNVVRATSPTISDLIVSNNITLGNNFNIAGSIVLNTNKFIVNGSNGNTVIAGTFAVAGIATFAVSPLVPTAIAGDITTKAASTEFVANGFATKFNSALTGTTTAQALTVTGAASVGTDLTVNNNLSIGNNIALAGSLTINGGTFVVNGSNGNTVIGGTLSVAGIATFAVSPIVPTPPTTDNSQAAASTAFVQNNLAPAPFAVNALALLKYTVSPAVDPLSAGTPRSAAQITNGASGGICWADGTVTGEVLAGTWIPMSKMTAGKVGLWRRTA